METTKKKWTRRMYTPEFKLEVLSYYYTHGEHRRKTYEKFGISETNLRQWLKNYRIEKKSVSLQSELENASQMRHRQELFVTIFTTRILDDYPHINYSH